LGKVLNELKDRDRLVVATKVYFRMHDGPIVVKLAEIAAARGLFRAQIGLV